MELRMIRKLLRRLKQRRNKMKLNEILYIEKRANDKKFDITAHERQKNMTTEQGASEAKNIARKSLLGWAKKKILGKGEKENLQVAKAVTDSDTAIQAGNKEMKIKRAKRAKKPSTATTQQASSNDSSGTTPGKTKFSFEPRLSGSKVGFKTKFKKDLGSGWEAFGKAKYKDKDNMNAKVGLNFRWK